MGQLRKAKSVGILLTIAIAVFFSPVLVWYLTTHVSSPSLPAPDVAGHLPLSEALAVDVIDYELQDQPIGLEHLSQLLWSMQGVTSPAGFRVAPSAGGTYPLEVIVAAKDVANLEDGFYQYEPVMHSLNEVSANESLALQDCVGSDYQEIITSASAVFIVLAEYERTTQRYGQRGVQYVHLEVGHALQNALLQMASLSLRTQPILAFDDGMLQELVKTEYSPLLILPVGHAGASYSPPVGGSDSGPEEMTVEQAISSRRSVRDYLNDSLPNEKLLEILNSCTLAPLIGGNASHYSLRLVSRDVTLLDTGLHEFSLTNGTLAMLSDENLVESIFQAGLSQPWIREAQVNLVISAEFGWTRQFHDADFQWRVMLYNIGMLSQIVYLKCASMGLGTVAVGGLYEDQVAQVVQVPEGFTSVYIMPIGVL